MLPRHPVRKNGESEMHIELITYPCLSTKSYLTLGTPVLLHNHTVVRVIIYNNGNSIEVGVENWDIGPGGRWCVIICSYYLPVPTILYVDLCAP